MTEIHSGGNLAAAEELDLLELGVRPAAAIHRPPRVGTWPLDAYRGTAVSTRTRTVWASGDLVGMVACKRSAVLGATTWQAFDAAGRPLRAGGAGRGRDAVQAILAARAEVVRPR